MITFNIAKPLLKDKDMLKAFIVNNTDVLAILFFVAFSILVPVLLGFAEMA